MNEARDLVALGKEVLREMAPHEAGGSGDQRAHSVDLRSPVVEHVAERSLVRNRRFPARRLSEFGAVSEKDGHVRRPEPLGIHSNLDFELGHPDELVEDLLDGVGLAGADVVGLAGLAAAVEREPVAAHDVPHGGGGAPGFQGSNKKDRRAFLLLDGRELLREVRGDEDVSAARAVVVEAARPDHLGSEALEVLISEIVLTHLADRVGGQGPQGIGLPDGKLVFVHQTVLLAGAGDLDPGIDAGGTDRLEEVQLSEDVRVERFRGRVPGRGDEALRREVEDAVRPNPLDEPGDRALIAEVALQKLDLRFDAPDVLGPAAPALGAVDLGSRMLGEDVLRQVAPGEAGDSGNQYTQAMTPFSSGSPRTSVSAAGAPPPRLVAPRFALRSG